jgi:hypothetical protein
MRSSKPLSKHRHYRPCERFMEDGGIFGRCTKYPYRSYRFPRVYWTIIRLSLKRFSHNSANERASDWDRMTPRFAYQTRPKRMRNDVDPQPKRLPEPAAFKWREAA